MIVQTRGEHLLLIPQPDHARLAGRLVERWPPLARHPRRDDIVLATAEHDAGWAEADAAPCVNANGTIVDFVHVPAAQRQAWGPRTVARLAPTRPWAAALVAEHALFVYDRFRRDPEWKGFFAPLEGRRDVAVAAAGRTLAELRSDYVFLRLADLMSLAFCTGDPAPQELRGFEVALVDGEVRVTPAAQGVAIPFKIAAARLPNRRFAGDDDLRRELAAAPRIDLVGTVVG